MSCSNTKMGLGIAIVLSFASGCASLPEPEMPANGEALATAGKSYQYTYTSKEKVGYLQNKGSSAKTNIYADKTKVGQGYEWSSYQGAHKISDDTLFHIAKDPELEDYRKKALFQSRLGLGILALGVATVAAGAVVLKTQDEGANRTVPTVMFLGSGLLVTIGSLLWSSGSSKFGEKHPFSEKRVRETADRYNATLP